MKKFASALSATAIILVITIALFVVINLAIAPFVPPEHEAQVIHPLFEWSEASAKKWIDHYGVDVVRKVYPGKSDEEIKQIVSNKLQVGNRYEPFVEFLMDPIFMDGMAIHEAGFRLIGRDQGPWPIDKAKLNVFVFGGSTTFGAGARDEEAIPAQLQVLLRERLGNDVNVYNFGQGAYYSSQEVIDFWRLARDGNFPDLVVYVDGLNDYFQKTEDTAHSGWFRNAEQSRVSLLSQLELDRGPLWHLEKAVELSPLARLVAALKTTQIKPNTPGAEDLTATTTMVRSFNEADYDHIKHVTERLLNNFALASGMAASIGAESAFTIQPTPMHAYDLDRHPFPVPEWHQYTRIGYPYLQQYLKDHPQKESIIWCAEIQKDVPKDVPLYVDPVHYTAAADRLIAQCIMTDLDKDGILARLAARGK